MSIWTLEHVICIFCRLNLRIRQKIGSHRSWSNNYMGGALWVWSVGCVWNMSQVVVIIHSKVCVCMLYADHYPVLVLYMPTTLSCCTYLFLHQGLTAISRAHPLRDRARRSLRCCRQWRSPSSSSKKIYFP